MEPDSHTVGAKVGAMAVLGGTALVCTTLPLVVARRCAVRSRLQPLLRFGGGVLLATTFLHLLPELGETAEAMGEGTDQRMPELFMCIGFFFMYLVEEVAHFLLARGQRTAASNYQDLDEEKKHICNDHDLNKIWTQGTAMRAAMITLAISVHQVFEGLAVGLESHPHQVWILTGAISAHKAVIAVCIGAELSRLPLCTSASLVTTFSLATPLGIATGLLLSEGASVGMAAFVLQAMAAGTLLYVVFFEVLRPQGQGSFINYLATLIGFVAMAILLYLFES